MFKLLFVLGAGSLGHVTASGAVQSIGSTSNERTCTVASIKLDKQDPHFDAQTQFTFTLPTTKNKEYSKPACYVSTPGGTNLNQIDIISSLTNNKMRFTGALPKDQKRDFKVLCTSTVPDITQTVSLASFQIGSLVVPFTINSEPSNVGESIFINSSGKIDSPGFDLEISKLKMDNVDTITIQARFNADFHILSTGWTHCDLIAHGSISRIEPTQSENSLTFKLPENLQMRAGDGLKLVCYPPSRFSLYHTWSKGPSMLSVVVSNGSSRLGTSYVETKFTSSTHSLSLGFLLATCLLTTFALFM